MDKINFTVNGEQYTLSGTEVSPRTTLNDYIRDYLCLYGTKAMCHEGGCGACIVSVAQAHPLTKEKRVFSVNSRVGICNGQWKYTEVPIRGFHVRNGSPSLVIRLDNDIIVIEYATYGAPEGCKIHLR